MRPLEDGSLAPEPGFLTDRINELPEMKRSEMPLFDVKVSQNLLFVDLLRRWTTIHSLL